ncbi:hypothetical protein V6N11_048123 [Hibiscus sabdariffa]|uniref:Uncharacterized protein n=2 Tax=Hibiscus sabdariffa TaxID=183260 RepID=A0ABR2DD71_9ROSI
MSISFWGIGGSLGLKPNREKRKEERLTLQLSRSLVAGDLPDESQCHGSVASIWDFLVPLIEDWLKGEKGRKGQPCWQFQFTDWLIGTVGMAVSRMSDGSGLVFWHARPFGGESDSRMRRRRPS